MYLPLQIPDKRFSRLRMHIPFPAVPLKNTQCPFPSVHQSITPGMQEAGSKLWGPGLCRERDSLEKEKIVGLFPRIFPIFQRGCTFVFMWQKESSGCDSSSPLDLMHSKRSWVFFLVCSRYLRHDSVTQTHLIFSLAFTNKKKTLIFSISLP